MTDTKYKTLKRNRELGNNIQAICALAGLFFSAWMDATLWAFVFGVLVLEASIYRVGSMIDDK